MEGLVYRRFKKFLGAVFHILLVVKLTRWPPSTGTSAAAGLWWRGARQLERCERTESSHGPTTLAAPPPTLTRAGLVSDSDYHVRSLRFAG